jgi:hypothetical protein
VSAHDGLGNAVNQSANTLRRKQSEPRVAAKLFALAPYIAELEMAARRALCAMQGLVDNNAVRLPYPGFDEALKSLRHVGERHRDTLDACRLCGDPERAGARR